MRRCSASRKRRQPAAAGVAASSASGVQYNAAAAAVAAEASKRLQLAERGEAEPLLPKCICPVAHRVHRLTPPRPTHRVACAAGTGRRGERGGNGCLARGADLAVSQRRGAVSTVALGGRHLGCNRQGADEPPVQLLLARDNGGEAWQCSGGHVSCEQPECVEWRDAHKPVPRRVVLPVRADWCRVR